MHRAKDGRDFVDIHPQGDCQVKREGSVDRYPWTGTKVPRGRRSQARRKLGREVLAQDGSALVPARATDTPSSPAQQKGGERRGGGKEGSERVDGNAWILAPADRCNLLCRLFHLYDKTSPYPSILSIER